MTPSCEPGMTAAGACRWEVAMSTHRSHTLALLGISVVFGACTPTVERALGVATTNSANVSNASAVLQIAKARCQRLAECNNYSNGHMFADEAQCTMAYQDKGSNLHVVRDCPNGVDRGRLETCVDQL